MSEAFDAMERELTALGTPVVPGRGMKVNASYWLDRSGNLTLCTEEHRSGVTEAWKRAVEKNPQWADELKRVSDDRWTRHIMADTISGGILRIRITRPGEEMHRRPFFIAIERPDGQLTQPQRQVLLDLAAIFPDALVDVETPESLMKGIHFRHPVGWEAAIEGGLALHRYRENGPRKEKRT